MKEKRGYALHSEVNPLFYAWITGTVLDLAVEGTHAFPNFVRLPVAFRENPNKIWFSSHKIVSLSPISENH